MGCDFPLQGYRTPHGSDRPITFNPIKALNSSNPLTIPCGRCTGCRLERSRQWAVRCMHEAQMHPENSFLTLTFENKHLPTNYSVCPRDLQLFFKKLRKALEPKKIRYFACGEYGDENQRPHYHALLFNHDFNDKVLYKTTPRGDKLFTSSSLSTHWPYGLATLGDVTFESAGYVARYSMKKQTGDLAATHYLRQHPLSKLWYQVEPEFLVQSRRPGIARTWLAKFKPDVYPSDQVVTGGGQGRGVCAPPRYYDNQLSEKEITDLKKIRKQRGVAFKQHQTPDRLKARAAVRDARIALYTKREL